MNLNEFQINKIIEDIKNYLFKINLSYKKYLADVFLQRHKFFYNSKKRINLLFFFVFYEFLNTFVDTNKKYIFHNIRHKKIIELFDPAEVLILSSKDDLKFSKSKGYSTYLIGFLHHSLVYFLSKNSNFYLKKAIRKIHKIIIGKNNQKKILFLWSDIDLSGLVLSSIFKNEQNIKTVCIAHGYFFTTKDKLFFLNDGNNCNINLLWDKKQKKLFPEKKDNTLFTLGLPYEVKMPTKFEKIIILVGNGDHNSKNYFTTIEHYKNIVNIFTNTDYLIEYRPHPFENIERIKKDFKYFNKDNKFDLLNKNRMIFIGFTSSLLFEAKLHGHISLQLDISFFNYFLDFEFTKKYKEEEYAEIPSFLYNFNINDIKLGNVQSLNNRFNFILNKIKNIS